MKIDRQSHIEQKLMHYLTHQLNLSESAINLALRLRQQSLGSLPIILWQYGLINIDQLEQLMMRFPLSHV